jgi:hypothetical protein
MKRGTIILLGVAAGTMLLGMATPFAWADVGAACRDGGQAFGEDNPLNLFKTQREQHGLEP